MATMTFPGNHQTGDINRFVKWDQDKTGELPEEKRAF